MQCKLSSSIRLLYFGMVTSRVSAFRRANLNEFSLKRNRPTGFRPHVFSEIEPTWASDQRVKIIFSISNFRYLAVTGGLYTVISRGVNIPGNTYTVKPQRVNLCWVKHPGESLRTRFLKHLHMAFKWTVSPN